MESLGDRTPTHTVLIYVSGHKTNNYKMSASSRAAHIPPPDGEVFLPTSERSHRRPLTRNLRYAPRGHPRRIAALLDSVARLGRLCWRQSEYGGNRPPAMSRQRRRCVATAGPSVMGRSVIADLCSRCIGQAPPVATSRAVV